MIPPLILIGLSAVGLVAGLVWLYMVTLTQPNKVVQNRPVPPVVAAPPAKSTATEPKPATPSTKTEEPAKSTDSGGEVAYARLVFDPQTGEIEVTSQSDRLRTASIQWDYGLFSMGQPEFNRSLVGRFVVDGHDGPFDIYLTDITDEINPPLFAAKLSIAPIVFSVEENGSWFVTLRFYPFRRGPAFGVSEVHGPRNIRLSFYKKKT